MARMTPHSALTNAGFKLAEENSRNSGRIGTVTTRRYTKNTGSVGEGALVRPITHHVTVEEYERNSDAPNVRYEVTQFGGPYADSYYDTERQHRKNSPVGVSDPVGDVLAHHGRVVGDLEQRGAPAIERIGPKNLHKITPDSPYHWSSGLTQEEDPYMKRTVYLRPGSDPELPLHTYSANQDQPLDPYVHRRLTGGAKGRPSFKYMGRIAPEDQSTDVYHAAYPDPEDPYMRYGFTVRHMPGAKSTPVKDHRGRKDPVLAKPLVFSYDVTHYPVDILEEGGDYPIGEFKDVTGESSPVANFTDVGPLIERHHNMLRSVGLMALPPRDPRPDWHFTASGPVSDEDWQSFISGRNPIQGMTADGTPVLHEFDPNFGHDEPNPRGGSRRVYDRHASRGPYGDVEIYDPKGNCVTCGRPTWNTLEGGEVPGWENTGDSHYAEESGMHGSDIPQCANCHNDYDKYKEALKAGERPGGLWHHPGARINTCDDCYHSAMNEADEDLA